MIHADSDPAALTSRSTDHCYCISSDAVTEIRKLLIAQDVPVAAFIDDHVRNAIAQRNILSDCLRTISATADDKTKSQIFSAIEKAFPTRRDLRAIGDAAARWIGDRDVEAERAGDSMNQTSELPHD